MKKLMTFALTTLMVAACSRNTEDTVVFDTFSVDKEVKLSNDVGSPKCAVHLQLNYATGENGHKAEVVNNTIAQRLLDIEDVEIRLAADSFANMYTRSYVKNFLPLYNQDRADTTKRSWYEYHYIITSKTQSGFKGTCTYLVNLDYYEGGAHGINQELVMNFEGKTGRLLSLDDLFVPGYQSQLNPILEKALCEKTGSKNLAELHEKGYLYSMDMYPSLNFILNAETITFIYNPYEIAPYTMGIIELSIAYHAVDKILKEEFRP